MIDGSGFVLLLELEVILPAAYHIDSFHSAAVQSFWKLSWKDTITS